MKTENDSGELFGVFFNGAVFERVSISTMQAIIEVTPIFERALRAQWIELNLVVNSLDDGEATQQLSVVQKELATSKEALTKTQGELVTCQKALEDSQAESRMFQEDNDKLLAMNEEIKRHNEKLSAQLMSPEKIENALAVNS